MNKAEVRNIIESTLASGSKRPGLFELPKILGIKSRLESCGSVDEVIGILEDNRSVIGRSFGISDEVFNSGMEKLKALV
jgi:hypothetical protein